MKQVCIVVCCSVLQVCCRKLHSVCCSVLQVCCSALLQCDGAMCFLRDHKRGLHEASLHCSVLQCVAAVLQLCCNVFLTGS